MWIFVVIFPPALYRFILEFNYIIELNYINLFWLIEANDTSPRKERNAAFSSRDLNYLNWFSAYGFAV